MSKIKLKRVDGGVVTLMNVDHIYADGDRIIVKRFDEDLQKQVINFFRFPVEIKGYVTDGKIRV